MRLISLGNVHNHSSWLSGFNHYALYVFGVWWYRQLQGLGLGIFDSGCTVCLLVLTRSLWIWVFSCRGSSCGTFATDWFLKTVTWIKHKLLQGVVMMWLQEWLGHCWLCWLWFGFVITKGMERMCGRKVSLTRPPKCSWKCFKYRQWIDVHAAQINADLLTAHKHIKWKLLNNFILKNMPGGMSFFVYQLP